MLALATLLLGIRANAGSAEFLVNTYTTGSQYSAAVAASPSGEYVVVWQSPGAAEDSTGIYGRRLSRSVPLATEFRVNTSTSFAQAAPQVAVDASGAFVVAWTSTSEDGSATAVIARLFDGNGAPRGNAFRVNQATTSDQEQPSVAVDPSGMFTVAFEGYDASSPSQPAIWARPYRAFGAPIADESSFHDVAPDVQKSPSIAADGSGAFVVAWSGDSPSVSGYDVFARRFGPGLSLRGGAFRVNTATTGKQSYVNVSANPAGGFVVSWATGTSYLGTDFISARAYGPDGNPTSGEVRVNTYTNVLPWSAPLSLPDGSFVVVYTAYKSFPGPTANDIYLRHFDATGSPLGTEFQVNVFTTNFQRRPRIAGDAHGFLVVWEGAGDGDSDGFGIHARYFDMTPVPGDVDGDGDVDVSDIFYLINFLFAGGPAPQG